LINEDKEGLSTSLPRLMRQVRLALFPTALPLVVGLMAGFSLVILAYYYARSPHPSLGVVATAIESLGIGCIVASIVLFFYEWRDQPRKTKKLIAMLSDAIEKSSSDTLDRSLRYLLGKGDEIPTEYVRDVIFDIKSLIEAVVRLRNGSHWAITAQVRVLSKLIRDVRQNAESLTMLDTGARANFSVPRPAELVDNILAANMQALEMGDSYEVVSSLSTWRGGELRMLQKATEEAILRRNIPVRRIVSVFHHEGLPTDEVKDTLLHHLGYAGELNRKRGRGGYQVKLVGDEELARSTSRFSRERAKDANFAIFRHGTETLTVMINSEDLSDLTISSDPGSAELYSNMFHELWRLASPLTKDLIEYIMERDH
jgi:hypothetical protein